MPKARTGNFTLRTIADHLTAEQCTHRFTALQRSGQYSELRIIGKGKSFRIVGYKWPDKGIRRKLAIGRARTNPAILKKGTQWIVRSSHTGTMQEFAFDNEQDARKKLQELTEDQYRRLLRRKSNIGHTRKNPFHPFTQTQIAKARAAYAKLDTMPVEALDKFHKLFDKLPDAGVLQLAAAKIKFVSKLALNEAVRRNILSKNPSAAKGVTANQVLFGSRGQTLVGWINRETPTQYEITYKKGAQTLTVMRAKSKVKFMKPRRKNPCPKTANPSAAVRKAARLSEQFHGAPPRKLKNIPLSYPKALVQIGECAQVDYISDKFDGKTRRYFHEFENRAMVYAGAEPQPDGDNLLLIKGPFKIRPEGLTG